MYNIGLFLLTYDCIKSSKANTVGGLINGPGVSIMDLEVIILRLN